MTRKEIETEYSVKNRRIVSPGKFEGQSVYVPHFWGVYLDGFADGDNGKVLSFKVSAEDKREFPELKRRQRVRLVETDSGFVEEV